MDGLEKEGLVRAADRVDLLSNTLVVVVPADSAAKVAQASDLAAVQAPGPGRSRRPCPPASMRGPWLESLGLWSRLEKQVVPALNVRAALSAVESANADAGIVYKTDAAISKRVKVAFEVPRAEGPAIVYPLGHGGHLLQARGGGVREAPAVAPTARAVFARFGFLVLGGQ